MKTIFTRPRRGQVRSVCPAHAWAARDRRKHEACG